MVIQLHRVCDKHDGMSVSLLLIEYLNPQVKINETANEQCQFPP